MSRPKSTRAAHAAARTIAVLAAAVLALTALAAPAAAGIHYQAVTRTEPDTGDPMTIEVESWIEGGNAKIVFRESANPMAPAGSYMVTRDGGETVFLVDPEQKTYAEWDLEAMLGSIGAILQSAGPMLSFNVSNVEVEKLAEEPGGSIHGLATTRYRYRTSYDMEMKVIGIRRAHSIEQVEDLWVTDALEGDVALGVWLRKAPKTSFGELDELIEAEMTKVQGVPLKMEQTATTTGEKGKRSTTTRTTMEVTALERGVAIPAGTFEIPEGYTRTEMMVPAAGQPAGEEEEGGRNPFRRILGGGGDGE